MPGFGTTDRTYDNAISLMKALGVSIREIPIADAVKLHFRDINHDINQHDVTYELTSARTHTDIDGFRQPGVGNGSRHRRPVGTGLSAGPPTMATTCLCMESMEVFPKHWSNTW